MTASVRRGSLLLLACSLVVAACTTSDSPEPAAGRPAAEVGGGFDAPLLFGEHNDWEPAVAADPNAPWVYVLTTRYGKDVRFCDGCPQPIVLRRSDDGGQTWMPDQPLCECRGRKWQADPQIRVADDGTVYAAWLTNPFGTVFSRSEDHGQTWTDPIRIAPQLKWDDHPWLVVAPNGEDVYIGTNMVDSYIVSSHDRGDTWSKPVKTNTEDDQYFFHEGGVVLPDGTVVFSSTGYGCCPYGKLSWKRPTQVWIIRSTDGGASWEQVHVDTAATPPVCEAKGCPEAQYGSQGSVATDDQGNLLYAYNAGTQARGGERIWFRTSSDGGATWSERTPMSPDGDVIAAFPQAAGTGTGDFRVTWTDDREGSQEFFNVYYAETDDGGRTWSEPVDLSTAQTQPYQSEEGFTFYYGDYGDIAITNTGETVAVWGEAGSYNGPGTTWVAVQAGG